MIKYFVIRNFRGTYSYVEMLNGYMLTFGNAEGVHTHLSEYRRGSWSGKGWEPLIKVEVVQVPVASFNFDKLVSFDDTATGIVSNILKC